MSFKRFDQEDIVVSAETVTSALWTGHQNTLTDFYTSISQKASTSGEYYHDVFQVDSEDDSAEIQFAAAYADKYGFGSILFNSNVPGKSPSSAIYGQYRNLVLGDEESNFTFGDITSDYFYVITVDRGRYKEKLLPGTLTLQMTGPGGQTISITDNSNQVSTISYTDSGRVYELISGSNGQLATGALTLGYTFSQGSYGKFLPDVGVIIVNGTALDAPVVDGGLNLGTVRTTNSNGDNITRFVNAITGGGHFKLNAEETISSNLVFIRARNSEFNYSTNPSSITGSGEIRHSVMINSPQAFITTVGLYNDNNDLLAVAKLSKPLLKDFTKESLIKAKLNY